MKCKNPNCGNELTGRQKSHCSDRCRMVVKRTQPEQVKVEHQTRTGPTVSELQKFVKDVPPTKDFWVGSASFEEYNDKEHRRPYATRTNPERLNWGPLMTAAQLERAGLKANRVTIPGDWDCKKTA